ncbi:MAG TPA: PadR family transcriptional regulator [Candidatus Acidoferrum sp.]|jgi:DNA-binding PadR family transcriptional regulator|nr:PadR family transcriptional regulator [Candidatus Acidoferrum sp.]
MKQVARKRAADSKKKTITLSSGVSIVRILHYAGAKPFPSFRILERLRSHGCPIAPATLNRFLLRMDRDGLLKSKGVPGGGRRHPHEYALTAKGREALNLARERLKELVQTLRPG